MTWGWTLNMQLLFLRKLFRRNPSNSIRFTTELLLHLYFFPIQPMPAVHALTNIPSQSSLINKWPRRGYLCRGRLNFWWRVPGRPLEWAPSVGISLSKCNHLVPRDILLYFLWLLFEPFFLFRVTLERKNRKPRAAADSGSFSSKK